MLTDADRETGHHLAAQWLESVGDTDTLRLAHHHERGGRADRAIALLRRAAEQALAGSDLPAVFQRAERGVALGASADELGRLRLVEAEAHRLRGEFARALRVGVQALCLLPSGQSVWFRAVGELAAIASQLGERTDLLELIVTLERTPVDPAAAAAAAIAWARTGMHLLQQGIHERGTRAIARAAELATVDVAPEPVARARVCQALCVQAQFAGDPAEFLARADEAAREFERAGDVRELAMQRVQLALALLDVGDDEAARRALDEALAVTDRLGIHAISAIARALLGYVVARAGDLDLGRSTSEAALAALVSHGDRRHEASAHLYLAWIELLADRPGAAEGQARKAAACAAGRRPSLLAYALATQGEATRRLGHPSAALGLTQAAVDLTREAAIEGGGPFIALAHAEALEAAGRSDEARAAIAAARARLEAQAARFESAEIRASFLERVAVHTRTLALSSDWR
jgi:tetratricopeptide (TPR) repeat protein